MKKKIIKSMAAVLSLGLLLCTLIASLVFEAQFTQRAKQDMQRLVASAAMEAELLGGRDEATARRISDAAGGLRVTFVDAGGLVTGDSAVDAGTMENHAGREEIETAHTAKYGVSVRSSVTTGRNMLYVATRLSDGGFLRLADTYPSALAGFVGFLPALLVAAAVAFAITLVLADRFAKSITGPIEELSDSLKLVRSGGTTLLPDRYQYEELQDMAGDINQLSAEVDENLAPSLIHIFYRKGVRPAQGQQPAGRPAGAFGHDPALHHQRVGDRPAGGAAGV